MAQIEYSCKRKKDFVTFTAIAMFVAIFVFEIYLIVFIRVQLQRENAMASEVVKQKMLVNTEDIRKRIKTAKPKTPLQDCEVEMVRNCLDNITQYIRKNNENMTLQQISETNELLFLLKASIPAWEKGRYTFQQESLEYDSILKAMEDKLDNAAAQGH